MLSATLILHLQKCSLNSNYLIILYFAFYASVLQQRIYQSRKLIINVQNTQVFVEGLKVRYRCEKTGYQVSKQTYPNHYLSCSTKILSIYLANFLGPLFRYFLEGLNARKGKKNLDVRSLGVLFEYFLISFQCSQLVLFSNCCHSLL